MIIGIYLSPVDGGKHSVQTLNYYVVAIEPLYCFKKSSSSIVMLTFYTEVEKNTDIKGLHETSNIAAHNVSCVCV